MPTRDGRPAPPPGDDAHDDGDDGGSDRDRDALVVKPIQQRPHDVVHRDTMTALDDGSMTRAVKVRRAQGPRIRVQPNPGRRPARPRTRSGSIPTRGS